MPCVVWAEEPKTGLGFEIGPSYDVVPTRSELVNEGQSSCIFPCKMNPPNWVFIQPLESFHGFPCCGSFGSGVWGGKLKVAECQVVWGVRVHTDGGIWPWVYTRCEFWREEERKSRRKKQRYLASRLFCDALGRWDGSCGPRGMNTWYNGPSFDHYMCCRFYVPEMRSMRTSDSYDLFPVGGPL